MSEDASGQQSLHPQSARFSLASILLFTSVVAIHLGAIRLGIARDHIRWMGVILGACCGLLIGGVVGFVIAQGQSPRLRGRAPGLLIGALAGLGAGSLVALPESLWVIIPGAAMVVLFAAVVRWLSRPGPQ